MFRFGRSASPPPAVRWTQLLPLLEDDDRRAAVEREYPETARESFLRALRRVDATAADQVLVAGRQLEAAAPLANYPTVAIAGMLNSGKTSLVATFLSNSGKNRTLRGEANHEGTHRFVLWLPQKWQEDTEIWSLLLRRIGEALGHAPEMLLESPQEAHRQYNNASGGADALAVPLIATDPGLNALGLGLLDCPDIVSDAAFGRGAPEVRRELLRRAATLCSAFVVVTGAEAIRDATLGELLRMSTELMPGVPRLLAINKVRPRQTPESVWANSQELVNHHRIDAIYAAYDFDVAASAPFIPNPHRDEAPASTIDQLPCFYRVHKDSEDNPPATISSDRLLSALPAQLDRTELFEQVRLSLESRLHDALWTNGVHRLTQAAGCATEEANFIRNELLQAALDFFARREPGGKIAELRLHQSERIVRQLTQAFADAAPWYARFGMRMNSHMRRLAGGASDLVSKFTPSRVAEAAASSVREKIKVGKQGSVLTAERLRDAIVCRIDIHRIPLLKDEVDLVQRGLKAIDRFDDEDFTALDPKSLQEAVQEVWRQMPVSKKMKAGVTPLAIIFAAFGAALMAPIDFGGTGVIFAASIKELLVAAGFSLAAVTWGGGLAIVDVEQQAARQQLSNFLAVLCDTLGVPRAKPQGPPLQVRVGNQTIRLPDPTIRQRTLPDTCLVQWRVRNEFVQELQQHIAQS